MFLVKLPCPLSFRRSLQSTTLIQKRKTRKQKSMNKRTEKIARLWDRGVTDPRVIALKLGYSGAALTAGIERVKEELVALGYINNTNGK